MLHKSLMTVAIITTTTLISGCKLVQPEPTACWSENTKASVPSLAKNILVQTIAENYDETGKARGERPVTEEDLKKISDGLTIETTLYHLEGFNPDTDAYQCGLNISAKFKVTTGRVVELPTQSITFNIYPAEANTKVYSIMNGLWAKEMVKNAK